jgi:hypothetical protein
MADQFRELARFPVLEGKTWNDPVLVGDVFLVRNGEEIAVFRRSLAGMVKSRSNAAVVVADSSFIRMVAFRNSTSRRADGEESLHGDRTFQGWRRCPRLPAISGSRAARARELVVRIELGGH